MVRATTGGCYWKSGMENLNSIESRLREILDISGKRAKFKKCYFSKKERTKVRF